MSSLPQSLMSRKPAPVPLDARGVSLATSCLSRELYRLFGEFVDRREAYQIAVLVLQEYARGAADTTGAVTRSCGNDGGAA